MRDNPIPNAKRIDPIDARLVSLFRLTDATIARFTKERDEGRDEFALWPVDVVEAAYIAGELARNWETVILLRFLDDEDTAVFTDDAFGILKGAAEDVSTATGCSVAATDDNGWLELHLVEGDDVLYSSPDDAVAAVDEALMTELSWWDGTFSATRARTPAEGARVSWAVSVTPTIVLPARTTLKEWAGASLAVTSSDDQLLVTTRILQQYEWGRARIVAANYRAAQPRGPEGVAR